MARKTHEVEAPPPERTFELPSTLSVGGKDYDSITLRAPTFGEVRAARKMIGTEPTISQVDDSNAVLVRRVANVPEGLIEMLPFHVFEEAVEYLNSFSKAR